jgi:hypothetical protein
MGIHWYRMSLKPNIDRAFAATCVEEQTAYIRNAGWGHYEDLREFVDKPNEELAKEYGSASSVLESLIVLDDVDLSGTFPFSRPVSFIATRQIFPAEWRIEAYRSFLPDQLPAQLDKWESYLMAVRTGSYRSYLFHWYLYEQSRLLRELWDRMQFAVQDSEGLTNAWALKPNFQAVRKEVHELSQPPHFSVPHFAEWQPSDTLDHLQDSLYVDLSQHRMELMRYVRRWNHVGVPSNRRIDHYNLMTFDEFMMSAHSQEHDKFFDWLQKCCDYNMGLFIS